MLGAFCFAQDGIANKEEEDVKTWKTMLSVAIVACAVQAPAAAQDKVRAGVGQRGNLDTMVIAYGVDAGFFKKENIDVEITWTRGGAETLQALITGSTDLDVANGILGVIGAWSKGAPVRIVSAQFTGASDLYWYAKAESPVKSMKDMDGRTLGYSRPGSSTNLVAMSLAAAAGVKPKLVSAGGIPDNRTQVMSGQIDAGWAIPPFNLDLLNEGKIRVIARGSDVPALAEQTVRVNVASQKFLTERRDVARRFMKAYHDTFESMYTNPEQMLAFFAKFNKVSPEVAKQTFASFPRQAVAPWPVRGLQKSLDQALEYKQLQKPMKEAEAGGLFDFVYQPK
jgi:NitT/TauT family transport system substrate-binding protein